MALNSEYDEKVLFKLIDDKNGNQVIQETNASILSDGQSVDRFITFHEIVSKFGIGIMIFPSLIKQLGGN